MDFIRFLAETAPDNANKGNSWPMLVLLGGMLILMVVMSVIPQRKRQKQAQEMMNSLVPGQEIRTVGGIVGVIVAVGDDGLLTINIGTEEAPVIIKLMKEGVYTVSKPVNQDNK